MQGGLDSEGVVVPVREGQGHVQLGTGGYVQARAEGVWVEGRGLARVVQLEGERGRGVDRGLGSSQQRPGARAGEPVGTCSLAGPRRGIGGAAEPGQAQGDAAADRLRAVQYRAGGQP